MDCTTLHCTCHCKHSPNLAQHNKRHGIGHPVGDGRAQYNPRKDLADQTGHLEDALGERPHEVDEGEEDYRGVEIVKGDVDAEFGVMLSIVAAVAVVGFVGHVAGIVNVGLLGQESMVRIRAAAKAKGVRHKVPQEGLNLERHIELDYLKKECRLVK